MKPAPWNYTEKPVCYGYRTELDIVEEDRTHGELEIVFEDENYSEVLVDIYHNDKMNNGSHPAYAWLRLPIEEIKRLHKQLGNMIEYAETKSD